MQLTSEWLYVNLVSDSIPTLVGFLRALRFPPTPKNQESFQISGPQFLVSPCV